MKARVIKEVAAGHHNGQEYRAYKSSTVYVFQTAIAPGKRSHNGVKVEQIRKVMI